MFKQFFTFELRFWLRSWMLWVFFLIVALMFFGAASTDQITVGNSLNNTYRNAPWVVQNFYAVCSLLTLLMTTAFVNSAASRDFAHNTHQIMFSTPIRKIDYLAGRFLGSALVAVIPLLGVSAGVLAAKYMPWVDAERWGPVVWAAHWKAILVFAVPNTLFIAAVIFAIAVLTRSTVVSFLGSLALLAGYGVSRVLTSDLKNQKLAALIDPFGIDPFLYATKYWTVAEKNTLSIGYSGYMLWNRLIWLGVGALIFAFAYWRFSFAERSPRKKKVKAQEIASITSTAIPTAETHFGAAAEWLQFWGTVKIEFKRLVKTTTFIVITAFALLNCVPALIFSNTEGFGNTFLPVTYRLLEVIAGTLYLFLIAMITYFAGVLAWEERDSGTDEVHDALPNPEWPTYLAKLTALMSSIVIILAVVMCAALLVQFFHGYHRYQIGLFVANLFGIDLLGFVFLAILAFFIHVISPNKYVGYFGYITFLLLTTFIWWPLHIATYLVQFGQAQTMTYSDFYGYASVPPELGLVHALLVGVLRFPGGAHHPAMAARDAKPVGAAGSGTRACVITGRCALSPSRPRSVSWPRGGWIFYNTKVLNTVRSENDDDRLQADYEKTYKKFEKQPEPRVTDVKYAIDLYPESRNMTMRGQQTIVNQTSKPLTEIHFTLDKDYETTIEIPGAKLSQDDQRLHYQIYALTTPMQPGESRLLQFTMQTRVRGFENTLTNRAVLPNGTFIHSQIVPQIGYQPGNELDDKNKRKRFGLKEKDLMPALEQNCTADCRDSYISNNSDWVNVETVISTSPDQIAIAPGSLQREWNENGRRYFQYKLDHAGLNYYSFLSGRYEVARTEWNGINIEVYYLKEQPWNVPKMLNSVKKSFEYYTKNFGPYPQKEARIIEFPRLAAFAEAFPGTMPYSESIGFIASIQKPDDIDMVFYVVAHEMAHQWWGHQEVGANMQGATLLVETLAQYSALMTMEKEYGRDTMRKFMQYEMDNYLRNRGAELLKERPLLRVEASQGYIHYRKGSVVMYYLREMIGEDAVNRAVRKVLNKYGYAPPPYPTSYALVDALREETPPQLQYLIQDLFYDITLFSNRAVTATAHKGPDGKYQVTVETEARKFKADEKGNETEVPVDDWIEVGALAAPEKGKRFGKVLHRERVHMTTGKATYSFTTDEKPDKAGIDPLLLLIDRVPDDNMVEVTIQP